METLQNSICICPGPMTTCPPTVKYNCTSFHYVGLDYFAHGYDIVHIPLSLVICVCGVFANSANVVVLNQPPMRSSTNLLMAALSVGEGTVMAIYIFYVSMFRIGKKIEVGMTKSYAYTLFGLVYVQNLFHAFSSWMIVFVAAFRLVFMSSGVTALQTCSYTRAKIIILTDVFLSLILAAPFLFAHHVVKDCGKPAIGYEAFKLDFVANHALTTLLLVSTGVFMKVLPILLSTIFSTLLIRKLLHSQKRRDRLQSEMSETEQRFLSSQQEQSLSISPARHHDHDSNSRNIHQTTNILFGLSVLYIITYLPQAVMLLLLNIYDRCFEVMVYEKLGDFMDLLTLLCNGGNFILYYAMSSKFRETFLLLLRSMFLPKRN
uniref:G_PROTEIN_RECEP_F1_2 domain-containing protein n=1 Tax=Mesocestoides corti TaxID=53468 RepID=A0A5K3FC28_MESCO